MLETNVDEIASAGPYPSPNPDSVSSDIHRGFPDLPSVAAARKARRESYAAANPLSLGGSTAGTSQRGSNSMSTPLGWLAGKVTGLKTA